MTPSDESDWQNYPVKIQDALLAGWNADAMPASVSALYSRWWQLETWLRSLIYVELRAAYGAKWANILPSKSATRQQQDEAYQYMQTPDAQDQLAYLDASLLLQLTHHEWLCHGRTPGKLRESKAANVKAATEPLNMI